MIKNIIISIVLFIFVLTVPYMVNAGVVLDAKNQAPSGAWVDPNATVGHGDFFVSKDGLLCANRVWQVNIMDS